MYPPNDAPAKVCHTTVPYTVPPVDPHAHVYDRYYYYIIERSRNVVSLTGDIPFQKR